MEIVLAAAELPDDMIRLERLIASFTGQTSRFGYLDGDGFSEAEFEKQASPTMAIFYAVKKALARYLSGDAESALRATEELPSVRPWWTNGSARSKPVARSVAIWRVSNQSLPIRLK
jgi:hypothetical protein